MATYFADYTSPGKAFAVIGGRLVPFDAVAARGLAANAARLALGDYATVVCRPLRRKVVRRAFSPLLEV